MSGIQRRQGFFWAKARKAILDQCGDWLKIYRPVRERFGRHRSRCRKLVLILGRIWAGKSLFHRENRPFTAVTGVLIPVGTPDFPSKSMRIQAHRGAPERQFLGSFGQEMGSHKLIARPASSRCPGARCEYRSVTATVECPASFCTVRSGTPAMTMCEMKVCRSVCKLTSSFARRMS